MAPAEQRNAAYSLTPLPTRFLKEAPIVLLRQFIAPYLLITNSREQNSLPIHMLMTPAKIAGVVIL